MTTYSKYNGNVQTKLGASLPGAQVHVYLTGTTTPAALKADDGVTALPNPLVTDFNGMFAFNADVSAKYDISVVAAGVSVMITNITLPGGGGSTGVSSINTRTGAVVLVASDIPVMVGSGASHAAGLVPDPGVTAGTTKFLREDGTFQVPPGAGGAVASVNTRTGAVVLAGTDIPAFVGAGASHAPGAVPDPGVTPNTTDFLRRDGSWATPAGGGGGISPTIVTTKGDVIGATAASTPARIPVGADGTVLTADSAQALGVKWAAPSGGGGGGGSTDPGAAYASLIASMANLVSHFKMNEAPGATVALDSVGTNNLTSISGDLPGRPGSIVGSNYGSWQTVNGLRNSAPTSLPLGASARTTIAWVRSTTTNTGVMPIGYGSAGARNAFLIYLNGGSVGRVSVSAYGDDLDVDGLMWNDGEWHMICAGYDGATTTKLWFDGVPIGTHTLGGVLTTALNADGLFTAASATAGGFGAVLPGFVDNLSVFSRQLSNAEVLNLWNKARGVGASVVTDWQSEVTTIGAATAAPTKGTIVRDKIYWRRVGDTMECRIDYRQTSGAGTAGTGLYTFALPAGAGAVTIDNTKVGFSTTPGLWAGSVGGGVFTDETTASRAVTCYVYDTTHIRASDFAVGDIGSFNSITQLASSNPVNYSFFFAVPITEWA